MKDVSAPALASLADGVVAVVERLRRSVVMVRSGAGEASGTAWPGDGLIVTNSHAVGGESALVEAADGASARATVVARDRRQDLALLRARGLSLEPVETRDASSLRAGELVLAVGNAWGGPGAATIGVVSRAPAGADAAGRSAYGAVHADVRLAPGDSGGPLCDARGRVVGVNFMVAGGMGIAIPSEAADDFAAIGGAPAGGLGITAIVAPLRDSTAGGSGLLITEVVAGSTAERAGLLPGDIVLALDGVGGAPHAIMRRLQRLAGGRAARLDLLRGGKRRALHLAATAA